MKSLPLVAGSIPVAFAVGLAAAPAEWALYDARLALRADGGWPEDLVSVRIDEPALASLGGWPLRGRALVPLLDALRDAGAKTVVLDMFLGTVGSAEDESALAERLAHVVTAVTFDPPHGRAPSADELARAMVVAEAGPAVPPARLAFPPERIVASVARLGHAGFREGDAVRSSPPLVRVEGIAGALPSQALSAMLVHTGADPRALAAGRRGLTLPWGTTVALTAGETMLDLIPGGGGPREVDARALLSGAVARGSLSGALVVVHVDTPEDRHPSPLGAQTPGGWLLAAAIRTLARGHAPRVFPPWAAIAMCAGFALTVILLPARRLRLATVAALEGGWLAAAFALVPLADVFLPVIPPVVVFAGAAVAAALGRD